MFVTKNGFKCKTDVIRAYEEKLEILLRARLPSSLYAKLSVEEKSSVQKSKKRNNNVINAFEENKKKTKEKEKEKEILNNQSNEIHLNPLLDTFQIQNHENPHPSPQLLTTTASTTTNNALSSSISVSSLETHFNLSEIEMLTYGGGSSASVLTNSNNVSPTQTNSTSFSFVSPPVGKEDEEKVKNETHPGSFVSVLNEKNYEKMLNVNKFQVATLRDELRYRNLKVSGSKRDLVERLFMYFFCETRAKIIQKALRSSLIRQVYKYFHKTQHLKPLSLNQTDFYSMDEITEIPTHDVFSYEDKEDEKIYSFHISSLFRLFVDVHNSLPYGLLFALQLQNISPTKFKKLLLRTKTLTRWLEVLEKLMTDEREKERKTKLEKAQIATRTTTTTRQQPRLSLNQWLQEDEDEDYYSDEEIVDREANENALFEMQPILYYSRNEQGEITVVNPENFPSNVTPSNLGNIPFTFSFVMQEISQTSGSNPVNTVQSPSHRHHQQQQQQQQQTIQIPFPGQQTIQIPFPTLVQEIENQNENEGADNEREEEDEELDEEINTSFHRNRNGLQMFLRNKKITTDTYEILKKKFLNPYNRKPFAIEMLYRFLEYILKCKIYKLPIELLTSEEEEQKLQNQTGNLQNQGQVGGGGGGNENQEMVQVGTNGNISSSSLLSSTPYQITPLQIQLRMTSFCNMMNAMGNNCEPSWLLSLTVPDWLRLKMEFDDIWNHRAELSMMQRMRMAPPHGRIFPNVSSSEITQSSGNIHQIRCLLFPHLENLITLPQNPQDRELNSFYIIGALTMVSEPARTTHTSIAYCFAY